ncbi:MAG: hypothetical protein C5B50_29610 [Verrucomicrobia bacterium]|nr:MAG: hypothetical protein C5B50_29610 [Verrucomicrobiota bacterium]
MLFAPLGEMFLFEANISPGLQAPNASRVLERVLLPEAFGVRGIPALSFSRTARWPREPETLKDKTKWKTK